MASKKSTRSGGRQYGGSRDVPTPGTKLEICDADLYHANSGGDIEDDGYAPKIPFVKAYDPYNKNSRIDSQER